jgi:hypothetical protein
MYMYVHVVASYDSETRLEEAGCEGAKLTVQTSVQLIKERASMRPRRAPSMRRTEADWLDTLAGVSFHLRRHTEILSVPQPTDSYSLRMQSREVLPAHVLADPQFYQTWLTAVGAFHQHRCGSVPSHFRSEANMGRCQQRHPQARLPPMPEKNEAPAVCRGDQMQDDGVGGDSYVATSTTLGMVRCSNGGNVFQAAKVLIHVGSGERRSSNATDHVQDEAMFETT